MDLTLSLASPNKVILAFLPRFLLAHISSCFPQQTSALCEVHPCISGGFCGGWGSFMCSWTDLSLPSSSLLSLCPGHFAPPHLPKLCGCLIGQLPPCPFLCPGAPKLQTFEIQNCSISCWSHPSQFRNVFFSWCFKPSPWDWTVWIKPETSSFPCFSFLVTELHA